MNNLICVDAWGKAIAHREDMIVVSSYNNDANNHKSLGVDQEQAFEAHASTYNAGLSSVMPQH
jgi:hypothetical protein